MGAGYGTRTTAVGPEPQRGTESTKRMLGKGAVVIDGLQRYLNGVGSSLADTSDCDVRGEAEKRTTNEHQSTRMKKWLWWTLWGRGMGFARRQLGRSHKEAQNPQNEHGENAVVVDGLQRCLNDVASLADASGCDSVGEAGK